MDIKKYKCHVNDNISGMIANNSQRLLTMSDNNDYK